MKIDTGTLILGGLVGYYLYCSLKQFGGYAETSEGVKKGNNACIKKSPSWYSKDITPICNPLVDLGLIKCEDEFIPPRPDGFSSSPYMPTIKVEYTQEACERAYNTYNRVIPEVMAKYGSKEGYVEHCKRFGTS